MIRIVFASDSHLNKHYARMSPDQLRARRKHLREAWAQSVDYALAQKAELYIHGGDLFDGPNPRAAELVYVSQEIKRLTDAGTRCLLIGGNHDIPKTLAAGATPQRLFDAVGLAHVYTNPTRVTWWEAELGGLRLAVGGLPPDPRLARDADPLEAIVEPIVRPPGVDYALLLTHYAIEGTLPPQAEEPTIAKASLAALEGIIDHLLVGHVHGAKDMEVGGVKVCFPGPTERLSFGEMDLRCGFLDIGIEGGAGRATAKVKKHYIDPQPMRRETIRAADVPEEEATDWLMDRLRAFSAPDQILQLRLEGPLPRGIYHALRFRDIWHLGNELNFYFDLDRHLLTLEEDEPLDLPATGGQRLSPRTEIERVADGMLRAAEDEAERELVAGALEMALERYGGGSVEDSG